MFDSNLISMFYEAAVIEGMSTHEDILLHEE